MDNLILISDKYIFTIFVSAMRHLLSEQLRCLDSRLEMHLSMVLELQDFYKRRAEVEQEYSKGLDKLVKVAMTRHKDEKHRSVVNLIVIADHLNKHITFNTRKCRKSKLN